MAHKPDRVQSDVEKWILARPEFMAICDSDNQVYAAMKMADHENWPVERFLELCVKVLATAKKGLVADRLSAMQRQPFSITIESPPAS